MDSPAAAGYILYVTQLHRRHAAHTTQDLGYSDTCCCLAGVYVAITQLEPLMAYVFTGSVLLRFCSKPYQRDITPDTDIST